MNGEIRKLYRDLLFEANCELCGFCKFNEGGGCDEGPICNHPLGDYIGFPHQEFGLSPGDDCWAFRPRKRQTVNYVADVVGIVLAESFDEWMVYTRDDGQIVVKGTSVKPMEVSV